ncbi:MAG: protein kinase domain-containing protein [Deltaproteobacteria bacterium]
MKEHLGHYDIIAELGRGGMGVVYKGYETSLNRYVAIKVLADSLAHDESVKERFLREARSMAALNDPHIISIYFIGDDAGQTYFVMEFVDGESLGSLLKREGKLKPEQAAKIVYQTAQGLVTAHDKGVIHRDIKPGNLMITAKGAVKIADFGIALSSQDFSKKLTSTGEFVGTPGYLSPEVCQGKPVDQRSDIFSLGIVLFECLAGRMPFTDESPLGLMLEVVKAEIPDVRTLNAEVDPELERILAKMVAKDPAERYQSCQELVADLSRHPLVAKGGPITLQTKMSTAAATMVGQKTPVSGQRPLPTTSPTPQPLPVSRPTTPAGAQPVMGAHQPVLQPQTAKSSPMLPLAIAAILILGLAGGAWAFRDRIPVLQQFLGASATTAQTPTMAMQTPAPTPAPAVQTTPANMAPAQQTAASEPPPPTDPRYAETTPSNASTAIPPTPAPQENPPAAPAQPPVASTATAPASAPPVQVATAAEPPKVIAPPKPHVPTIAILASGDDAISEPAEQAIESTLMHRGYRVVDQDSLPRVGRLIDGERPRFAEALAVLQGHADAVVFVHARKVGAQEMNYYGQTSTLYTAQLNVRAYSVEGRRQLGPPWSEQVNFTNLNAGDKAKEAVEPMLERVSERLVDYRPKGRRE